MLADKEMAAGVKAINADVQQFAGALLEGVDETNFQISSSEKKGVQFLARRWNNATYIAIVSTSPKTTEVKWELTRGNKKLKKVNSEFAPYGVEIFSIGSAAEDAVIISPAQTSPHPR